jgi:hypothetical protein
MKPQNQHSQFELIVSETWVPVEKYVTGQVVDLGGTNKANVHVVTSDGTPVIVDATQDLLFKEEKNHLYRPARRSPRSAMR